MTRLIDADLLLENYNLKNADKRNPEGCDTLMKYEVADMIEDAPTVDAVPVVRCKDCKHFTEGMAIGMCYRIPGQPILPIVYDHFCSYGEMRKKKK